MQGVLPDEADGAAAETEGTGSTMGGVCMCVCEGRVKGVGGYS